MQSEYVIVSKIRDKQLLRVICYRVLARSTAEATSLFLQHQKSAIAWDVYPLSPQLLGDNV